MVWIAEVSVLRSILGPIKIQADKVTERVTFFKKTDK